MQRSSNTRIEAQHTIDTTHVLQDPFAEKTVYHDNAIDKFFIKLYSQKMADQLNGAAAARRATASPAACTARAPDAPLHAAASRSQRMHMHSILREPQITHAQNAPCMKHSTHPPLPHHHPHPTPPGVPVPDDATYDDFVRISKEIMRGRGSVQQREVVRQVLRTLMPEQAPPTFRCGGSVGTCGAVEPLQLVCAPAAGPPPSCTRSQTPLPHPSPLNMHTLHLIIIAPPSRYPPTGSSSPRRSGRPSSTPSSPAWPSSGWWARASCGRRTWRWAAATCGGSGAWSTSKSAATWRPAAAWGCAPSERRRTGGVGRAWSFSGAGGGRRAACVRAGLSCWCQSLTLRVDRRPPTPPPLSPPPQHVQGADPGVLHRGVWAAADDEPQL
jgi:hypothetical protein